MTASPATSVATDPHRVLTHDEVCRELLDDLLDFVGSDGRPHRAAVARYPVLDSVTSMVTSKELDRRVERALAAIRDLPSVQRDIVVERILRSDPELGGSASALLAAYKNARTLTRFGLIRRDSLTD